MAKSFGADIEFIFSNTLENKMQTTENTSSYIPQPQNLESEEDSNQDQQGMGILNAPPVNEELQRKFKAYLEGKKNRIPVRAPAIISIPPIQPGPVGNNFINHPTGCLNPDEGFMKVITAQNGYGFIPHPENPTPYLFRDDRVRVPVNPSNPFEPPIASWVKPVVIVAGWATGLLLAIIVKFGISGLYDYLFKSDSKTIDTDPGVLSEADLNTPD